MKKLLTILFAVALGLNLSAQTACPPAQDANQDGVIGVDDLMDLLSHWGDTDFDFDGVYDSVDLCTDEGACNYLSNPTEDCLYLDAIGACGGDWSQLGDDIDGEAADDYSGCSVSLSSDGTVVAIGAFVNDGNGSDSGHVVFTRGTGAVGVNLEVTSMARRRMIIQAAVSRSPQTAP